MELCCTYDPATRGGGSPDGRKVKGTLHWVSASHAATAEVRLYDTLFTAETPGSKTGNMLDDLNSNSLTILEGCKIEPALEKTTQGETVQFERHGYFCVDVESEKDSSQIIFNRTIGLRDTWAKLQKQDA